MLNIYLYKSQLYGIFTHIRLNFMKQLWVNIPFVPWISLGIAQLELQLEKNDPRESACWDLKTINGTYLGPEKNNLFMVLESFHSWIFGVLGVLFQEFVESFLEISFHDFEM